MGALLLFLRLLAPLLFAPRRGLMEGMLAEMASIAERRERVRFGVGLLGATSRLLVRDWGESPRMWAASIAAGAAMPFIDTHDGLQCVLVRLLVVAGVALGFLQPRAPWRWAIALILGVAGAAQFSLFPGFLDRGDLTPTTLTAFASVYLAAFLRRASALTGVLRTPT